MHLVSVIVSFSLVQTNTVPRLDAKERKSFDSSSIELIFSRSFLAFASFSRKLALAMIAVTLSAYDCGLLNDHS